MTNKLIINRVRFQIRKYSFNNFYTIRDKCFPHPQNNDIDQVALLFTSRSIPHSIDKKLLYIITLKSSNKLTKNISEK